MIKLFEVGGSVRDELLRLQVKDRDFAVEVQLPNPSVEGAVEVGFAMMRDYLLHAGFHIFKESPEYVTIRALFPKNHFWGKKLTADFVLCRKDGPSSDGRRPDYVEVGTIWDDLARRDFTMNAMAREITTDGASNVLIDPYRGRYDMGIERLKFVGDPMDRLREDGLRALRAIRFKITKGFEFDQGIRDALVDPETETLLAGTSVERRREELEKCFHHDTLGTMELLTHDLRPELLQSIFTGSLRVSATMKRDFVHAQSVKGTK